MIDNQFRIIVTGDYACFTRPELKAERVSYDVPTPGALVGMLKSVYWKPSMRYCIDRIIVFNPIRYMNIRRNEVADKLLISAVKQQMKDADRDITIYASEKRSQRSSMVLRDVCYGVKFHIELTGIKDENERGFGVTKHAEILTRRLELGQCFRTPCLGCSEFAVRNIKIVRGFNYSKIDSSFIGKDIDLGYMEYEVQFADGGIPRNGDWEAKKFSDKAKTAYYRPHIIDGIIDVAKYKGERRC